MSYRGIDKDIFVSIDELASTRDILSRLIYKNNKSIKKQTVLKNIFSIGSISEFVFFMWLLFLLDPDKAINHVSNLFHYGKMYTVKGECIPFEDLVAPTKARDTIRNLKNDKEAAEELLSKFDSAIIGLERRLTDESNDLVLLEQGVSYLYSLKKVLLAEKKDPTAVNYEIYFMELKIKALKQQRLETPTPAIAFSDIHKIVDSVQSSYAYANASLGEAKKFKL